MESHADADVKGGNRGHHRNVCAPIDANGTLTSDGTRTFEWDARNQLVAVTVGTHRSEFSYDGLQRRGRMIEKENSVIQSDTKVLWCDDVICEERAADGVTVTRRAFGLGEQINGQARFFATDHLGSVREVTDGTGTLLARYAFDPWGRRTVTAGTDVTTVGYTGHRQSADGWAAWFRTFDVHTARWLSENPGVRYAASLGPRVLPDGPNFFAYSRNNPVRFADPAGLQSGADTAAWPLVVKTCVSAGTAGAALLGAAIGAALMQCGDGCGSKGQKGCKPCVPPVGTIAYRAETSPSSRPHRGVPPPHWKLYKMSQSPYPQCKCFWDDIPDNRGMRGGRAKAASAASAASVALTRPSAPASSRSERRLGESIHPPFPERPLRQFARGSAAGGEAQFESDGLRECVCRTR